MSQTTGNTIVGSEILFVSGIINGRPSEATFPVTTAQIAGVLSANGSTSSAGNSAVSGSGTEAAPLVNADGTAGIQTLISALTAVRGGVVNLGPSRSNVSATTILGTDGIVIQSQSNGWNTGTNGESPGSVGQIIRTTAPLTSGVFQLGPTTPSTTPVRGLALRNIYAYGTTPVAGIAPADGSIGLNFNSAVDGFRSEALMFSGFQYGIYFGVGAGSGILADASLLADGELVANGYGIFLAKGAPGTPELKITNYVIGDNDYEGVGEFSTSGQGWRFVNSDLVRNASKLASFTGAISTTTLTVTGLTGGTLGPGKIISGASVTANTIITAYGTGTGGNGTYTVNNSQSVSAEAMTAAGAGLYTNGAADQIINALVQDMGHNELNNTFVAADGILLDGSNNAVYGGRFTGNTTGWAIRATGSSEVVSGATFNANGPVGVTSATTASGNAVLHFTATPVGVAIGAYVTDSTTGGVIPSGTKVQSVTATTVTMNANATAGGVGSGDTILFHQDVKFDTTSSFSQLFSVQPVYFDDEGNSNSGFFADGVTGAWVAYNYTNPTMIVRASSGAAYGAGLVFDAALTAGGQKWDVFSGGGGSSGATAGCFFLKDEVTNRIVAQWDVTTNLLHAYFGVNSGTPTGAAPSAGDFNASGVFKINGVKVLGAAQAGWGTSSNGTRAAINGSTATAAQVAAGLAQLLIDLTSQGILAT